MKKLIVHIEYEGELTEGDIVAGLDIRLELLRQQTEDGEDFGWRYFESLDEAMVWEAGDANIEVALMLVGHLRRMIGQIAVKGTEQPH